MSFTLSNKTEQGSLNLVNTTGKGKFTLFKSIPPSFVPTPSPSFTPSITPSFTVTPSITVSNTPSSTPSLSITPSRSTTPSISITPSISTTPSISISSTPSVTPSISVSSDIIPSITPTITATLSETPSISTSPSVSSTPSISITPSISTTTSTSVTPSISISSTPSITPSISISSTPSITPSTSVTPSISITPSVSRTPSVSITPSITVSVTPTVTPSPTPFVPIPSDPSLQIWYDGSDSTQFQPTNPTNGQAITQWTDKSATAHNAAPVGGPGTRPLYITNVQNGKSSVYFDQVEDGLEAPVAQLASLTGSSLIWVGKTISSSINQQIIQVVDKVASSYVYRGGAQLSISGSNNFVVAFASGSAVSNVPVDTGWHIHTLLFDGTQTGNSNRLKYRVDGVQRSLTFTNNVSSSTSNLDDSVLFGIDTGLNNDFSGYMGEVLFYTKTLTPTEVTNTENYLFNKWNTIPASPSPTPSNTPSVTPSVTATPSTTPPSASDSIRAQLTAAQQVTYDAASVGNWIKVTATQYNNIVNNVTGATKKGNSDAQVATRDVLTSWQNNWIAFGTGSTPSFQINTGEYIIAMITEAWNQSGGTSQLSYTTAFTGSVVANIGNAAGPSSGGVRDYFVRKAPTDAATETRYPTLYMTVSPNAVNGWPGFRSINSGSSWISIPNTQVAKIQLVTTSTKSW